MSRVQSGIRCTGSGSSSLEHRASRDSRVWTSHIRYTCDGHQSYHVRGGRAPVEGSLSAACQQRLQRRQARSTCRPMSYTCPRRFTVNASRSFNLCLTSS